MTRSHDERPFRTLRVGFLWLLVYAVFCALGYGEQAGPPHYRSITCTSTTRPICRYSDTGELIGAPLVEVQNALTVDLADRMAGHAGALGLASAADMFTTSWALRRCPSCAERNPFGADVEARLALKLGYGTAALGACWLLERGNHRGWAKVVRWSAVAIFTAAAANNAVHAIRRR